MTRTLAPFFSALLLAVLSSLFVVASTAFVTIPYAMGSHPGEAKIAAVARPFHPT